MTETMTRPYTLWPGNLDPALVDKAAWLFKELVALSTRLDADEKQRWVDAADRAVEQLLGGARFELDPDGERVHFLSRSEARRGYEHWNTTTAKACDCRGTTEGKICWNRPARHILRTLERWGVPVEPPLATAPVVAGFACPHCAGDMLLATAPGGDAVYECTGPCGWVCSADAVRRVEVAAVERRAAA